MQQVTTSPDRTRRLIDSIASHLRDPGFCGMSGDAGEGDAPRFEVKEKEDVIRNEATPSQDLNGEEACSGKDGHVGGDEVLPTRALAAFRRWRDAVALQNVSDRLIGELMAEIGESASNAIVTPAFVLLGHAEDQRFDFTADARTSRVGAMPRAVELAGDQPTIPGEDGLRFRNTGYPRETLPPQPPADFGQVRALDVRKPQSSGNVGAQDSILRNQVFALEEQALIDQACYVRQQPCPVVVLHHE